ncbi:MAG: molybdopterin oxidoreductase family protein, partial [Ktedonobacterales bacterium]
ERLRTPLIRKPGNSGNSGAASQLVPATWDEALSLVASKLRETVQRHGANAVGGIGSTHTTNEEAYLFQKLLRAGLGTNNVDHRHGRFPAVERNGLPWVWTDSIAGLEKASHIVLLGTDTYNRQPVIDLRIRKAIRGGARVTVLSARPTRLDRLATEVIHYQVGATPAIARALLSVVTSEGLTRGEFAQSRAASVAARDATIKQETPERLGETAGVDAATLRTLARDLATADGAVILYDEMATLEPAGDNLAADALDLALLTGNYGRPGAGVGPLLADNNSLGARDMGLLPDTLPGYRPVADASARARLADMWGAPLPEQPGLSYDQMLAGGVKALYVMGADPVRHLTEQQVRPLDALDFLVVQDMFLTETAMRADVVLPAVAYTEKDGTFTNTERNVQVTRRAMLPLPGARADWEILSGLARALGLGWADLAPARILSEIAVTTPLYAGATRRALGDSGARWPLTPGEKTSEGRATVQGSSYLTWAMLEQGLTRAANPGEELAMSRGRGE